MGLITKEFGVDRVYSHLHPTKAPELLSEHKKLTLKYYNKIIQNIDFKIVSNKLQIDIDWLENMVKEAVVLHDEGKINPAFQYVKMKNESFKDRYKKGANSNHSYLSAKLFFKKFIDEIEAIEDDEEFYKKFTILLILSFIISKHHSKLNQFDEFKEYFLEEMGYSDVMIWEFDKVIYIFSKLVFSILISSDYYATIEYMADIKIDKFKTMPNVKDSFDRFYNSLTPTKEIDKIRKEIYQKAEQNIVNNKDKNVFYLQAPTGAGKTLISLNLALQFAPNKIFYIFPFNTLIEQTKSTIQKALNLEVEVINSVTPIEYEEGDMSQYEKIYLNRLFYDYPFILTTHIKFFDILFGINKEDNFPLWQLAGSVIVLDEIQSYDVNLWRYMAWFFDKYAQVLNLKIIIMSATLPKIDSLLGEEKFISILDTSYFNYPIFRDRVDKNFSMLKREIGFDDIIDIILKENSQKVLVEFIKKTTANRFFEYIDIDGYEIYLLSGDDNKLYRDFVINETKKDKKIILVATQVIEAGVDIDMDLGLKDISLIESEEQFMGRINRNSIKQGKVYFFNYDDTKEIYRGDLRVEFNIKKDKNYLSNYQFYYKEVLNKLYKKTEKIKGVKSENQLFIENLKTLHFKEIKERMTLIKNYTFTIFIPFQVDISNYNVEIKGDYLEDGFLDGKKVWEEFKSLNKIENYAHKKLKTSYIYYLMQFFTFTLFKFGLNLEKYQEECCGIYLFDDYEMFIDNGRFLRDKFNEYQEDIFL